MEYLSELFRILSELFVSGLPVLIALLALGAKLIIDRLRERKLILQLDKLEQEKSAQSLIIEKLTLELDALRDQKTERNRLIKIPSDIERLAVKSDEGLTRLWKVAKSISPIDIFVILLVLSLMVGHLSINDISKNLAAVKQVVEEMMGISREPSDGGGDGGGAGDGTGGSVGGDEEGKGPLGKK